MHRACASSLLLVLAAVSCDRPPPPANPVDPNSPQKPDKSDAEEPPSPEPVFLRYGSQAADLRLQTSFELTSVGGGTVLQLGSEFAAELGLSAEGQKLKVRWAIDDIERLELGGNAEHGPGDPKTFVSKFGSGAYLTDLRGVTDESASDELVENAAREAELKRIAIELRTRAEAGEEVMFPVGPEVMRYLMPVIQLPTLPKDGLIVGQPTVAKRDEEREFEGVGVVLPIAIETSFTLVKVEGDVAELEFRGAAAGEADSPSGTFVLDSAYDGRLMFDVSTQLPISYEVSRTESWQLGEVGGETTTVLRSAWQSA